MTAASKHVTRYPFKFWGFGEEIALKAMLELPGGEDWVADMIKPWCEQHTELSFADHVTPGNVILELYERTGEQAYLDAALRLAELHLAFEERNGLRVHRPDLQGLSTLIWVDCMALDAPFLIRLARMTGEDHWLQLGIQTFESYSASLADTDLPGLFRHAFDCEFERLSPCIWGRGNGWALHGLVAALEFLPENHQSWSALQQLLSDQLTALAALQSDNGLWHTILNDANSPLENSTAAFFASGALKAKRLGLSNGHEPMTKRAVAAVMKAVGEDGALPVSYATPAGERATYMNAPLGVFPWGQGPLLLTCLELQHIQLGRTER